MGQREQRERHCTPRPISITRTNRSFMEYRLSNYPACFNTHLRTAGPSCQNTDDVLRDPAIWVLIFICGERPSWQVLHFECGRESLNWQICMRVSYNWSGRKIVSVSHPSPLKEKEEHFHSVFLSLCLTIFPKTRSLCLPFSLHFPQLEGTADSVCHKGWTWRTVNGGDLIH